MNFAGLSGDTDVMSDTIRTTVEHNADLGYTIVGEFQSHWVDFKVYEIVGWETFPRDGLPVYRGDGLDVLNDFRKAEVFLSGHVKWDGCSDWSFNPEDNCAIHFCSKEDGEDIGRLFARLYEIASGMEAWGGDG